MYGLDLFTGIGGITLALQDYVEPLAYCEIDPYCQSALLQRMQEGNLPKAPIWDDIRTLPTNELPPIDIIYGGFPCQDISIAGRQKGLEGERSGLFFEILRIIDAVKTPFLFLENVPNIRTKGAERVCKELAERGYDCRWCNISAADVGARHKRERWFLLANSKCERSGGNGMDGRLANQSKSVQSKDRQTHTNNFEQGSEDASHTKNNRCDRGSSDRENIREETFPGKSSTKGLCEEFSNPECEGLEGLENTREQTFSKSRNISSVECDWTIEPSICRVVNGLRNRVDRIKALGNSVVPLQVKTAFELLMGM